MKHIVKRKPRGRSQGSAQQPFQGPRGVRDDDDPTARARCRVEPRQTKSYTGAWVPSKQYWDTKKDYVPDRTSALYVVWFSYKGEEDAWGY